MSPWNLVASLSCNHSPRTPVDFVLPQTLGVKDLICFTESGKGCVQEPRKSNPYALQQSKLRPKEGTGIWSRCPVIRQGAEGGSSFLTSDSGD